MLYNIYMLNMNIILVILFAYLFGSIPWALVVGKLFYKTDVRKEGSGNLGGSNAGRVLGKKVGIIVTILDALKCVLPVYLGTLIDLQIGAICGIVTALGHCYPIFANFKGGKAVATSAGFLLAASLFLNVSWWIFILFLLTFFTTLYITKYVSFASMLAFSFAYTLTFVFKTDSTVSITIALLAILIIFRHRENVKRLIKNEERKITWM